MMTQGEAHIFDGAGFADATSNRWGDYSDMTVDPVDDQTFWYTRILRHHSSFNWRTRIGNFKLGFGGRYGDDSQGPVFHLGQPA